MWSWNGVIVMYKVGTNKDDSAGKRNTGCAFLWMGHPGSMVNWVKFQCRINELMPSSAALLSLLACLSPLFTVLFTLATLMDPGGQPSSSKKEPINQLYATCRAPNSWQIKLQSGCWTYCSQTSSGQRIRYFLQELVEKRGKGEWKLDLYSSGVQK